MFFKAYGYAAKKREVYKTNKLCVSGWDLRGFTFTEGGREAAGEDDLLDCSPCSGNQQKDAEKA